MAAFLFVCLLLSQIPGAGIEKNLDVYQELICPDKNLCN